MNVKRGGVVSIVLVVATGTCNSPTNPKAPQPPVPPALAQSWSDEFDGPLNAPPDPARWTYDTGAGGWGNQELQTYTSLAQNAHLDGQGHLVVHVESTSSGFTSARLKTKGLFAARFGSMEARIKLPFGQGIWPAFWMLGDSFNGGNWPQCGEIDIMENIGREPSTVHGTLHGPGYSGAKGISAKFVLPTDQRFADDFHTFKIQWAPQAISFYVDNVLYQTVTPASLPAGTQWVFDNPFFVLLNVAVGGTFPGSPDATTQFPQDMLVDYVRYVPLTNASVGGSRSFSNSTSPRLDIDEAIADALGDFLDVHRLQGDGSENLNFPAEKLLEIDDQIVEVVVRRFLEFDQEVDIAATFLLAPRVRTEKPDPLDRVLLERLVVIP